MTYTRVIPRDFFNEAKLLKCMGRLSLLVHSGPLPQGVQIHIEESGEPFRIAQSFGDGRLAVSNYPSRVNGKCVLFATSYNSKAEYPLYCCHSSEEVEVFDEQGNFTTDFINFARNLLPPNL